jgi:hypothetical protein
MRQQKYLSHFGFISQRSNYTYICSVSDFNRPLRKRYSNITNIPSDWRWEQSKTNLSSLPVKQKAYLLQSWAKSFLFYSNVFSVCKAFWILNYKVTSSRKIFNSLENKITMSVWEFSLKEEVFRKAVLHAYILQHSV